MTLRTLAVLALLTAGVCVRAEDRGDLPSQRLRANGELVLINATVVDGRDHLMTGLRPEHFRLTEEKQEQQLKSVTLEETPVSVVVLFDVSGSMKRELGDSLAALDTFLDALRPDDDVSLILFADRPVLAVPFTRDAGEIREAARAAKAGGGTALLDAMVLGFSQAKAHRDGRRHALVLFTDGGDRNSRYNWREIRQAAREADARVYPFLLWSASDEFAEEQWELRGIADDTGGRMFAVSRSKRLPEEVAKLELHKQYVLGFVPGYREKDGRFRRVKVELRDQPAHLKVFWKHGYFTPIE